MNRLFLIAVFGTLMLSATALAGPKVAFDTNHGTFVIELNPEKAPITVKNFLQYVDSGFYANTVFHRVISTFMIQGGGFTPEMQKKKTQPAIKLESGNGLSNARGTVAMARTANRDSATSQFFVNVVTNKKLDTYGGGYAVFGKVIRGMDVVDKIKNVKVTRKSGMANVPVEIVLIKSAKRIK